MRVLIDALCRVVQCPGEECDNSQAYFYQVQIRSADEPMTTFYKVSGTLETVWDDRH